MTKRALAMAEVNGHQGAFTRTALQGCHVPGAKIPLYTRLQLLIAAHQSSNARFAKQKQGAAAARAWTGARRQVVQAQNWTGKPSGRMLRARTVWIVGMHTPSSGLQYCGIRPSTRWRRAVVSWLSGIFRSTHSCSQSPAHRGRCASSADRSRP